MTKKIVVFVFIFCSVFSFSQESKVIDSLKRELKLYKKNTYQYADANNEIAKKYWAVNWDSVYYFANKANKVAKLLKYSKGLINSYLNYGIYFERKENFKLSEFYRKKALNISIKIKNNELIGKSYFSIGNLSYTKNHNDSVVFFYKKAELFLKKSNNYEIIAGINNNLAALYQGQNDFNKALVCFFKSLEYYKKAKNKTQTSLVLSNIGVLYQSLGNDKLSKEYFLKSISVISDNLLSKIIAYNGLGNMYENQKKNDSALYFFEKGLNISKILKDQYYINFFNLNKSSIYLLKKENNLSYFILRNINVDSFNDRNETLAMYYRNYGVYYYNLKKYIKAKEYIEKSLFITKENKLNEQFLENNRWYIKILAKLYHNSYLFDYSNYSDSLISIKYKKNNLELLYSYDTKYRTAEKEAKIKEQQLLLQNEKANRNMALGGIAGLVLLSGGAFWLYRTKQKQNQLQTQNTLLGLQQNLNAMQLENLNKQLNPHEIKNILANISPEIQRNAPEAYNKMTKLLNITRASLSSNSVTDSIENQLQQIEDYLSLEKTVLPVRLQYTIHNTVETNKQIPRLLLKNLVENSIKHGIKNKKEGGEIKVNLLEKENTIFIEIDDTGIGRQQAISLDSGIGTSTYINLFETLNKTNTQKASFNIIDKENGTKVEIYIPKDYKYS
ncbi:tetratricopeptide repeat-containing sensor histidine kinase [Flavobacterium croceum]|nr:tetratricopeptide repeat protein [Flavobacterium croceum]